MYNYIKGVIEDKQDNLVIIDNNGIGYEIHTSNNALEKLPNIGDVAKVLTYQVVKEDEISLYGFYSKEEKNIAKAKANNMPNDNISRSIKKASGEGSSGTYESISYEGYGIGGSAVIVDCLTDNKNRTAGDIRHIFDKANGSLGSTGCVSYLFDRQGIIIIEQNDTLTEDQLFEWALEAEADDVINEDGVFQVITNPSKFTQVRDALEEKGLSFLSANVELVPQSYIDLDDEKYEKFKKMIDNLEDNDDVQNVYHNVNMKEEDDEE